MNFLPKEVQAGLDAARKRDLKRKTRMRVRVGDEVYPLLRFEDNGFTLDSANAPYLRGLVDLYDGGQHLSQCLIVASEEDGGERVFEFKRATETADGPPLDYEKQSGPAGLLTYRASLTG